MSTQLTNDERTILDAIRETGAPVEMFELVHRLAPPPLTHDGRRREVKAWNARTVELIKVLIGLWERGILLETRDGDELPVFSIAEDCPSCHTVAGHPHTDYCQAYRRAVDGLHPDQPRCICPDPIGDGSQADSTCPIHGLTGTVWTGR